MHTPHAPAVQYAGPPTRPAALTRALLPHLPPSDVPGLWVIRGAAAGFGLRISLRTVVERLREELAAGDANGEEPILPSPSTAQRLFKKLVVSGGGRSWRAGLPVRDV